MFATKVEMKIRLYALKYGDRQSSSTCLVKYTHLSSHSLPVAKRLHLLRDVKQSRLPLLTRLRAFLDGYHSNLDVRSCLEALMFLVHPLRQPLNTGVKSGRSIPTEMAEIPQWRRKIPPSRSRTPMLDLADPDSDMRPSSALAGTASRPPTPKKGLRPKLTSYLSQSGPFASSSKPEPEPEAVSAEYRTQSFPSWVVEDPYPAPSAEQLTNAIMCRLMSRPYDALEPQFNGTLLQIFEAYRHLEDEKRRLQETLAEEMRGRQAERSAMQDTERKFEEEKKTYKAEVKRLELVIANGKRGVAEVALVRQDSLIRRKQMVSPDEGGDDDGKETVFEFLEKTKRFEDPSWSGQRGLFEGTHAFAWTAFTDHEQQQ